MKKQNGKGQTKKKIPLKSRSKLREELLFLADELESYILDMGKQDHPMKLVLEVYTAKRRFAGTLTIMGATQTEIEGRL